MRQWYREIELTRVRVSWRCEMCDVEEHKVFDRDPMGWSEELFEHDWAFVLPRTTDDRGPAVCSRTCAEAYAARMVQGVYPSQAIEETRRETARGALATAAAAKSAGERARRAAYATRGAIRGKDQN
jgi:hypothetical protein